MRPEIWAIWILAFVVLELVALKMGGGTLTHYVRRFFSIRGESLKWKLPRWALIAVAAWVVAHFYGVFQ